MKVPHSLCTAAIMLALTAGCNNSVPPDWKDESEDGAGDVGEETGRPSSEADVDDAATDADQGADSASDVDGDG